MTWGRSILICLLAMVGACAAALCVGAAPAGAATVREYTTQGELAQVSITANRVTFRKLPVVFLCASGYQVVLYDDGTYLNRSGDRLSPLVGQNHSDKYRLTGHLARGVFVGHLTESYNAAGYRGPCTASVGFGNGFYYVPQFKTKFVTGAGVTAAPLEALIMYDGLRYESSDSYWAECYHCSGSSAGPITPQGGGTIRFTFTHPPIVNDHSTLVIGRSGPGALGRFRTYRLDVYRTHLTPVRTFCTPPAITSSQVYNDVFPSAHRRAVTVACPT